MPKVIYSKYSKYWQFVAQNSHLSSKKTGKFRVNLVRISPLKNLEGKENNPWFIILFDTIPHFMYQSINQVFIVLGIDNFGYRMPKVIRHLLAKDSTGQTVQWWKMSNKWLDNICQSILPLTQNWTGKNDDDDEPLQKGYLRLYEVRSQIRLRTAQELEGNF